MYFQGTDITRYKCSHVSGLGILIINVTFLDVNDMHEANIITSHE